LLAFLSFNSSRIAEVRAERYAISECWAGTVVLTRFFFFLSTFAARVLVLSERRESMSLVRVTIEVGKASPLPRLRYFWRSPLVFRMTL
jgi:hypothetical protein